MYSRQTTTKKMQISWEDEPHGNQVSLRTNVDKHLGSFIGSKKVSGIFPVGARTMSKFLDPS